MLGAPRCTDDSHNLFLRSLFCICINRVCPVNSKHVVFPNSAMHSSFVSVGSNCHSFTNESQGGIRARLLLVILPPLLPLLPKFPNCYARERERDRWQKMLPELWRRSLLRFDDVPRKECEHCRSNSKKRRLNAARVKPCFGDGRRKSSAKDSEKLEFLLNQSLLQT